MIVLALVSGNLLLSSGARNSEASSDKDYHQTKEEQIVYGQNITILCT